MDHIRDFGIGVMIGLMIYAAFKLLDLGYRNTNRIYIDRDRDYARSA